MKKGDFETQLRERDLRIAELLRMQEALQQRLKEMQPQRSLKDLEARADELRKIVVAIASEVDVDFSEIGKDLTRLAADFEKARSRQRELARKIGELDETHAKIIALLEDENFRMRRDSRR
jgi:hypothetical protein